MPEVPLYIGLLCIGPTLSSRLRTCCMCPRPSMLINTHKHTCKWTRAPACLQLFTAISSIHNDLLIPIHFTDTSL